MKTSPEICFKSNYQIVEIMKLNEGENIIDGGSNKNNNKKTVK